MLERMADSHNAYVDCRKLGFFLKKPSHEDAPLKLRAALGALPNRVFKTHDLASKDFDAAASVMPNIKIITIRRDFKDVVISRFFYYRYHWPANSTLGLLPSYLRSYFAEIDRRSDREAVRRLLQTRIIEIWSTEWAAFETEFSTSQGLRINFEDIAAEGITVLAKQLELFTGLKCDARIPFNRQQIGETETTGRTGSARFHREGRTGQYLEWFTELELKALNELGDASIARARLLHGCDIKANSS